MRLLPAGDRHLLVELDGSDQRRSLDRMLRTDPLPGVVEHVPAAVTVLVRVDRAEDLPGVAERLRALDVEDAPPDEQTDQDPLVVEVAYDGEDLAEVADLLNLSAEAVVERHTGQLWTVDFSGFAPGFGYLVGDGAGLEVPRRDRPRTRIPAGAVGLADAFTCVYPHSSAGGWQLIGSTELPMWDARRDPPALLTPGQRVRFVAAGR